MGHQGRLAGAVLAHHPMDLAAIDRKGDAVVGDKPAIALDDADGFDLGHETGRKALYFAAIGSAIFTEPSTI